MDRDFSAYFADSRGFRIPPHSMEKITELAHKMIKLIADSSRFSLNLDEIFLALDIVRFVLKGERVNGENPLEKPTE